MLAAKNDFLELSRKLPVITHEQTHWLDLVSTVWGQEYIVDLFDAYEAAFNHLAGEAEYHWWKGITRCAAPAASGSHADILAQIMATPMIQCDQPQWTKFGISLAGFNAIFSLLGGMAIIALWKKKPA